MSASNSERIEIELSCCSIVAKAFEWREKQNVEIPQDKSGAQSRRRKKNESQAVNWDDSIARSLLIRPCGRYAIRKKNRDKNAELSHILRSGDLNGE